MAKRKESEYDQPTLKQALARDDALLWRQAVQTELDTLLERGTWNLVPRPPRARVLPSKVVLKIKRNPDSTVERYKARLVVVENLQRPDDYDETFSPVVDFTTVRTALTSAVHTRSHIHHVDVTGAFLYGDLAETIYMTLTSGFEDPSKPDMVCHLQNSLYGLKQAPRI